jgi:hypothetical protein
MSRPHIVALLALSAFAVLASPIHAQAGRGAANRSVQGRVTERNDIEMCNAAPGGSRVRENCEIESETLRLEQKIKFSLELAALESVQCGATTTTEYQQVNTVARVSGTLEIADCSAASGAFKVELLVKDDHGAEKPLEFSETWQRSDDQDVSFTSDYPIGENVELVSVRLRGLSCTCGEPAQGDLPAASEPTGPTTPP